MFGLGADGAGATGNIVRPDEIDPLCAEYRRDVSRWFEESRGGVLAHPAISHRALVDRVLAKRRPFRESEKGYRDVLIWYTVLEEAEKNDVILLTANTSDFGEKAGESIQLARDLVEDLVEKGLEPTTVELVTSTRALLERLPSAWDSGATIAESWVAFGASHAGREVLNEWLDARLGLALSAPPVDGPSWLWDIGLRHLDHIDSVSDIRVVEDGDGWSRVISEMHAVGRLGGYGWAWSTAIRPGDGDEFVLWDDWGGVVDYYCSEASTAVVVRVAVRFCPPDAATSLEVVDVDLAVEGPIDPADAELRTAENSMRCLWTMLKTFGSDSRFLEAMFGDYSDEFQSTIGHVLYQWEEVADRVGGRFTSLSRENVAVVLSDPAGLRALEQSLGRALEAIRDMR